MVINKNRYRVIVFVSFTVLIVLIAFAAAIGTVKISVLDVFKTVLSRFKLINGSSILKTNEIIIFNIRLPRALLACFIGMGLSMVGLVYQGIFKNPMADPFVLGTSSGSALGAAIAIVLGIEKSFLGLSSIAGCAFAGAILTTFVVYNIAKVGNRASNTNLLLSGVAMNFFLSSIISFIMVLDRNQVEKIVFWTLGSLAGANDENVLLLILIVIPSSFIIYFFYRDLNIITTGEETASSLGVEVERVKNLMFIISSLIVATCVSVSGIIGFVGLIMPHIVKIIIGPDYKKALPLTLLWGASFMVLCDILSRSLLSPAEIPVGVITSFFGAPYFIYLLYKDKKEGDTVKDDKALEIKNLSYAALSNEILKSISCGFKTGLFYSIIGPNGSGKTTLLRHISRNLMPREDVILIEGKDINDFKGTDFAKIVSYVPQQIDSFCTFTAFEVVLMGRYPHVKRFEGEKKKDIDIALWAMKATNTFNIKDKNINLLSGGERQRVIIARALAQQGKILLLDEPTAHLDIHHQIEIMDALKQLNINYGITVLCVLHDLNTACEYSDYVVVMKDGKIENMGKPQEVLNEKLIKKVYGIDVSIIKNPMNGNYHIIPQSSLKSNREYSCG